MKKTIAFIFYTLALNLSAQASFFIPDGAVTSAKLATNSVSTAKIIDAAVSGVKLGTSAHDSFDIMNLGYLVSVSGNALTVTRTQADGTTAPTASLPTSVGFRSGTSTAGAFSMVSATATAAITVPASTTLGTVSTNAEYINIYEINNAGTMEIGLSVGGNINENAVINTTAVSGGTTRGVVYTTTARSLVPVRLTGQILITEATAGTWATAPTVVSVVPFFNGPRSEVWLSTWTGTGSTNTNIGRYSTIDRNFGTDITLTQSATLGDSFTVNTDGVYGAGCSVRDSTGGFSHTCYITVDLSNSVTSAGTICDGSGPADSFGGCAGTVFLRKNQVVRCYTTTGVLSSASCYCHITKVSN